MTILSPLALATLEASRAAEVPTHYSTLRKEWNAGARLAVPTISFLRNGFGHAKACPYNVHSLSEDQ